MQEILHLIRRILEIMAMVMPIAAFIFFRHKFLDLIRSRTMWALLTVGWCFWAISGGVWNWILGPKLFQKTKEGFRIIVLHEDYQTLSEMFFIAALSILFRK
ncbi:OST3 / OST6 family, transporter family domain-containing protein [Phthorimaea operculella]|nr:OST3 / OST6 family, transporter family domain-containing protein [Phthorimaea operculella]